MFNDFNTAGALKEAGMYYPQRAHAMTSGVLVWSVLFIFIFLYVVFFCLRFVSFTQCFLSVCITHSLFSFGFFLHLFRNMCVLIATFQRYFTHIVRGGSVLFAQKTVVPNESPRKSLSHNDVSVIIINHTPSLGITKNFQMNKSK